MSKTTDLGIYLKKTKTFYYLEYGDNYVSNTLDRVKKTLVQRGLISAFLENSTKDIQYSVLSLKEADQQNYDMTPIYISKHIQNLYQSKTTKNESGFL